MTELAVGDQVRVTTLVPNHEDDPRDAYYIGEIVWFSGVPNHEGDPSTPDAEWVGVRCTNLGHTIHVVDRDRIDPSTNRS